MKALHKAIRMSPYIRVDSNYCARGHGLNIAPWGTSRDKNNKTSIDNCSESIENKDIFGKLRIRPVLVVYFQPRTRWCYRAKINLRTFFSFLIQIIK